MITSTVTVAELWGDWAILIGAGSQTPGEGELRLNSGQDVSRQVPLELQMVCLQKGKRTHQISNIQGLQSKRTHHEAASAQIEDHFAPASYISSKRHVALSRINTASHAHVVAAGLQEQSRDNLSTRTHFALRPAMFIIKHAYTILIVQPTESMRTLGLQVSNPGASKKPPS